MALIYNNLLINKNSAKYRPFLFNMISGRRRLLGDDEFRLVCSIMDKQTSLMFNNSEENLIKKLCKEKQFVTDEDRAIIENKMMDVGHFDTQDKQADELHFSVELTQNCNMSCSYCYAQSRIGSGFMMDRERIDAIYRFYSKYADKQCKITDASTIRITGGEPLINRESVDLIKYIAETWPNLKLNLFTNGVNLLKFYDNLPLVSLGEVHISLDGTKETHMATRYADSGADPKIYDSIISGIKKLLNDGVAVKIKSVVSKYNYKEISDLDSFLAKENISTSPGYSHEYGFVCDHSSPLDLDEGFNDKHDVFEIQKHLSKTPFVHMLSFPSSSILFRALGRPMGEPSVPKHQRCKSNFLHNYYFSCDGNIYFCDCIREGKGTVGTYYPNIFVDSDAVTKLANRNVMSNDKCRPCAYKFFCLGGCPLSDAGKGTEMNCGIFSDEDIMDNLEFNYQWVANNAKT